MNPYILTTLLFSLGLGTTLTFASSHWLLAWMGLEINTLAIIPLMAKHNHPRAIEATTKYFLIQATAAAMLLFASLTNAWLTGQWDIQLMCHPLPTTLASLALALKIGLAPLHTWLPEVLQGLDLPTGLILSTWQKLAPLTLLLQLQPLNSSLLIVLGLTSTLLGGWGGLNQTQLRKILAYSSTAHLGWMVLVLQFAPSLTFMTLIIYLAMTLSTFLTFNLNHSTTVNTLATSWAKTPVLSSLTPLILLSLGGLPPLTGFMPKWLILQELTKQDLAPAATLAALSALLSLYFYLRLSYSMTLTMSPNTLAGTLPWRLPPSHHSLPLAILMMISLTLLPLTPSLMALFTL
uniref:NADH-ubiquinone oxidoreductase chain 2 n=1 Tax=Dicentrarchus punctatus TaxID=94946 RepID=A0A0A7BXQ8_9TELE|nr:NADH dehydrogenase subunit 2 [Dicentrarchus punctatus]AHN85876.1 NADH dehydrogenase subunit 2 [Dicentrarchus punctatus]